MGVGGGGGGDVEASCEGAVAGAGDDDGAGFGVVGEEVDKRFEFVPHGSVEGVEFLGAVDFEMDDEGGGRGDVEVWCFGSFVERHGCG